MTTPELAVVEAPDFTEMAPLSSAAESPVASSIQPVTPAETASAECTATLPVEDELPAPDAIITDPPDSVRLVEGPAVRETCPPPELVSLACKTTCPPERVRGALEPAEIAM